LTTPQCDDVFATDASLEFGAILQAPLDHQIQRAVTLSACERRGGYSRLETRARSSLIARGCLDPDEERDVFPDAPLTTPTRRPTALVFDVIEVGGAAGAITRTLGDRGFSVGPLIDPSRSAHYDLLGDYACEWLCWLLANGRVSVVLVWCLNATWTTTTRPRLRTKTMPLGFGPPNVHVRRANQLLSRHLACAYVALRSGRAACLVFARGSLALHTAQVRRLLDHDGVQLVPTDACSYNDDQRRDQPRGGLRLLLVNCGTAFDHLTTCSHDHGHARLAADHHLSADGLPLPRDTLIPTTLVNALAIGIGLATHHVGGPLLSTYPVAVQSA
jgi:hypothetical protein